MKKFSRPNVCLFLQCPGPASLNSAGSATPTPKLRYYYQIRIVELPGVTLINGPAVMLSAERRLPE